MNITIQNVNPNQQISSKSLKHKIKNGMLPFAFGALFVSAFALRVANNKDTFEKKSNTTEVDTTARPQGYIDDVKIKHFDIGDALYIKQRGKNTRIQFDEQGNVYGIYSQEKDENGKDVFDTYHLQSDGAEPLEIYHIKTRNVNDSTIVTDFIDRVGDLIYKDSTVYTKSKDGPGCISYLVPGPSKLNNENDR